MKILAALTDDQLDPNHVQIILDGQFEQNSRNDVYLFENEEEAIDDSPLKPLLSQI